MRAWTDEQVTNLWRGLDLMVYGNITASVWPLKVRWVWRIEGEGRVSSATLYSWNGPVTLDLLSFEPLWDGTGTLWPFYCNYLFKGDLSRFHFDHTGESCSLCVTGQTQQHLRLGVMWQTLQILYSCIIYNLYILYFRTEPLRILRIKELTKKFKYFSS